MRHLSPEKAAIHRLFDRARTIAVIGASPRARRHSHTVTAYLRAAGYDVIPVRPDEEDVAGLKSYARLEDVAGPVDIAIVYRNPEDATTHVEEAAAKGVEALWLPPGVGNSALDHRAHAAGIRTVVRDRCPEEAHREMLESAGNPRRSGVHLSRRKDTYTDHRKHPEGSGYTSSGGGGSIGGGGVRAVLDEKKMVAGKPSPRAGERKNRPV
jgi:predicted CoA-binding protein